MSVMVGLGWAGSTSELDSGHKNNKIGFLSEVSTTIFKDFMRCRRFSYTHAEVPSRALHDDDLFIIE